MHLEDMFYAQHILKTAFWNMGREEHFNLLQFALPLLKTNFKQLFSSIPFDAFFNTPEAQPTTVTVPPSCIHSISAGSYFQFIYLFSIWNVLLICPTFCFIQMIESLSSLLKTITFYGYTEPQEIQGIFPGKINMILI